MEHPHLTKENNGNAATRPLADLSPELLEQSLDVPPGQGAENGAGEDQLKGALVLPPRGVMVSRFGTTGIGCACGLRAVRPGRARKDSQHQRLAHG